MRSVDVPPIHPAARRSRIFARFRRGAALFSGDGLFTLDATLSRLRARASSLGVLARDRHRLFALPGADALHAAGRAQQRAEGRAGAAVHHLDGHRAEPEGRDRDADRDFRRSSIDTVLGLRSVDPEMLNLARSMRGQPARHAAGRSACRMRCRIIFAGMKVGISFALVGAIVGEFVAGASGLGYVILVGAGRVRYAARLRRRSCSGSSARCCSTWWTGSRVGRPVARFAARPALPAEPLKAPRRRVAEAVA